MDILNRQLNAYHLMDQGFSHLLVPEWSHTASCWTKADKSERGTEMLSSCFQGVSAAHPWWLLGDSSVISALLSVCVSVGWED